MVTAAAAGQATGEPVPSQVHPTVRVRYQPLSPFGTAGVITGAIVGGVRSTVTENVP